MSTRASIKRMALILDLLDRKPYSSFKKMREELEQHDFSISHRTLQRDIEKMREEFQIHIVYDTEKAGYFIQDSDSIEAQAFYRFLDLSIQTEVLLETFRERKQAMSWIDLESRSLKVAGVQYLDILLQAILQKRLTQIRYWNFNKKSDKDMELAPVLLKEYQNRWYVVGQVSGYSDIRIFALDRILHLEVKQSHFEVSTEMENPQRYFKHTIGLSFSVAEPTRIELSATSSQANYLKTLPLHNSQQVVFEDAKSSIFELFVVPNYEFTQKILMMGKEVKILKPSWLAEEIKGHLLEALERYR